MKCYVVFFLGLGVAPRGDIFQSQRNNNKWWPRGQLQGQGQGRGQSHHLTSFSHCFSCLARRGWVIIEKFQLWVVAAMNAHNFYFICFSGILHPWTYILGESCGKKREITRVAPKRHVRQGRKVVRWEALEVPFKVKVKFEVKSTILKIL